MDTTSEPIGLEGIIALALSDRIHNVDVRQSAERTAIEYVRGVLEELEKAKTKEASAKTK